ncbi:hypothetical protein [Cronobacter condimenti]|uniref:hypothetical protein n=1 Tax=Cronobacter condimenti TaxID=1163710 RepID=UPI001F1C9BF0|nr:hypothetical protein [Cronobacter condimenti]
MNIAEIVENGGSFSGEEFTICDPKRNNARGAAQTAKSTTKQKTTQSNRRQPRAVWLTINNREICLRGRLMDISSAHRKMMLKIYLFC